MDKFYLVYRYEDEIVVSPLIKELQGNGFAFDYDTLDGENPGTKNVSDYNVVLFLLSKNLVEDKYALDMMDQVRKMEKTPLLICLDNCSLPAGLELRFSRYQRFHYYKYSDERIFINKIINSDILDDYRTMSPQKKLAVVPRMIKTEVEGKTCYFKNCGVATIAGKCYCRAEDANVEVLGQEVELPKSYTAAKNQNYFTFEVETTNSNTLAYYLVTDKQKSKSIMEHIDKANVGYYYMFSGTKIRKKETGRILLLVLLLLLIVGAEIFNTLFNSDDTWVMNVINLAFGLPAVAILLYLLLIQLNK